MPTASYSSSSSGTTANTWRTWVASDTTDMTATTASNNQVWYRWTAGTSVDTSSTISSSDATVWIYWNGAYQAGKSYRYTPPPETEEQKQARLAREETARIVENERKRLEKEATERAEELLATQLDAEQLSDWKKSRHFFVRSRSGKKFRIRGQYSQNVDEYDGDKIIRKYCIVPQTKVPIADQMVMQKLMLEQYEEDFVRIANKF